MKNARIGQLDRIVEIEELVSVINSDYGSEDKEFRFFARVWAQYRPVTGSALMEQLDAMAIRSRETAIFVIRFMEGIRPDMRIVHDGKIYNIRTLSDGGEQRRRWLEIVAEAELGATTDHRSEIAAAALTLQGHAPEADA